MGHDYERNQKRHLIGHDCGPNSSDVANRNGALLSALRTVAMSDANRT